MVDRFLAGGVGPIGKGFLTFLLHLTGSVGREERGLIRYTSPFLSNAGTKKPLILIH